MDNYKNRMQVLKNDFALILESRFKEEMLQHAHKHGLWSLVSEARRLSALRDINDDATRIEEIFEENWVAAVENLSGGAKIDQVRWTYCENLSRTFKSVNELMLGVNAS